MNLIEFFDELKKVPIESQLVTIKLKYDHEDNYRYTNELLLVDENCGYYWLSDWNEGETDVEVIAFIPVSDIEIKLKGKWIRVGGYVTPGGDPVWRCSNCGKGKHVWGIEHNSYGADVADQQWVACPNCGIEMEGEQW
jgi:hypothetical protein